VAANAVLSHEPEVSVPVLEHPTHHPADLVALGPGGMGVCLELGQVGGVEGDAVGGYGSRGLSHRCEEKQDENQDHASLRENEQAWCRSSVPVKGSPAPGPVFASMGSQPDGPSLCGHYEEGYVRGLRKKSNVSDSFAGNASQDLDPATLRHQPGEPLWGLGALHDAAFPSQRRGSAWDQGMTWLHQPSVNAASRDFASASWGSPSSASAQRSRKRLYSATASRSLPSVWYTLASS
jgi:hypothetical protein